MLMRRSLSSLGDGFKPIPSAAMLRCPACGSAGLLHEDGWRCPACGAAYEGARGWIDLLGGAGGATGEHYGFQWSEELGFADFLAANPDARAVMPASQLGWPALLARISERAKEGPVSVYDAACGFGLIAADLAAAGPPARYVGADIQPGLATIAARIAGFAEWGMLVRWDVSLPLPDDEPFDFVLCRAAIHHTPDPPATFRALAASLAPGGTLAVSAYARKGPAREAVDDAVRERIRRLPPAEAFALAEGFAELGRALQAVEGRVRLERDVEALELPAGEYGVQELVYDHLLKCFYNERFGDRQSALVNYDWYHPEFAYRYEQAELLRWFADAGLAVAATASTKAQHYVEGVAAA
jgi:SAM-dependent methyltransferase